MISQIKCNDFTLCNSNNIPVAHGCYPVPSLINHSCEPNIFHYYNNRNQILRCCKRIEVGEELFVLIIIILDWIYWFKFIYFTKTKNIKRKLLFWL